jgi:hypothetical protein
MTTMLAPVTPKRVIDLTTVLRPLFAPADASLVPMRRTSEARLMRREAAADPKLARSLPQRASKMQRLESRTLAVPRVRGSMSRAAGNSELETIGIEDLKLPLGVSRFVTVATLRMMLKTDRSELFLKKSGASWEICPDTMRVDLTDDKAEYRVGSIQVYS